MTIDEEDEDCFVIPFQGAARKQRIPPQRPSLEDSSLADERYRVYSKLWHRVRRRTHQIIEDFDTSLAADLAGFVNQSHDYSQVGPPPQPVIPTAVLVGGSGSSRNAALEKALVACEARAFVSRINPRDCNTITNALRCLITGFIGDDSDVDIEEQEPRASTQGPRMSKHDIRYLEAWFATISRNSSQSCKMAVLIPDLEAFDPAVVQDLIFICRIHVQRLPLLFLIGLSTSPLYLHQTFPLETLRALEISSFTAATGDELYGNIITEIFLDREFDEVPIILCGSTMKFLDQIHKQDVTSLDSSLSAIQLLLLRHFSNPLTTFIFDNPQKRLPNHLDTYLRVKLLQTRSSLSGSEESRQDQSHLVAQTAEEKKDIAGLISECRVAASHYAANVRLGMDLLNLLRSLLPARRMSSADIRSLYSNFLDGDAETVLPQISEHVQRRSLPDLLSLLRGMEECMSDCRKRRGERQCPCHGSLSEIRTLQARIKTEQKPAAENGLMHSIGTRHNLADFADIASLPGVVSGRSKFAVDVSKHFCQLLRLHLRPSATLPLQEIWCLNSDSSNSLAQVLNPSTLSALVAALMRPHYYLQCQCCSSSHSNLDGLASLPDESVAFQRYLNSGKALNVYDWFESFTHAFGSDGGDGSTQEKQAQDQGEKRELQARFLRCFHEFDILGLLKHVGKKQDHVARTVFEVVD